MNSFMLRNLKGAFQNTEAESNIDKNNKVVRSFASRKNISSGNNTYQHFAMIGLTFSPQ